MNTHTVNSEEHLIARKSLSREGYLCQKPWPKNTMAQCGDNGIVLPKGSINAALAGEKVDTEGAYTTAFFEVFPKLPEEHRHRFFHDGQNVVLKFDGAFRLFIRGEGTSLVEAEEKAWEQWLLQSNCPRHDLDRRGRKDGYCYCKHCSCAGLWLEPTENCVACGVLTSWGEDAAGQTHCEDCYNKLPDERLTPRDARMRRMVRLMKSESGGRNEEEPPEETPETPPA